jgi:hypothetical protein
MFSLALIGTIILVLSLALVIMAIKTKANPTPTINGIDIKILAEEIAKAVGKEIAKELKDVLLQTQSVRYNPSQSYQKSYDNNPTDISIDDRIVPIKIDTKNIETNLDNMAKEEVKSDTGISNAKNKLAALKKKKDI